jgi:hypothetical protein
MIGLDDNGGLLMRTGEGLSGFSLAEYAVRTMAAS